MSDAEKIAREIARLENSATGVVFRLHRLWEKNGWNIGVLEAEVDAALIAAEARGCAAAREQEATVPEIEFRLDPTFRRAIARNLASWDFRLAPRLNILLPKPTAKPDEELNGPEIVALCVEVEMRAPKEAGGKPFRVFIVKPASLEDEKLIDQWVEERKQSQSWLREGEV